MQFPASRCRTHQPGTPSNRPPTCTLPSEIRAHMKRTHILSTSAVVIALVVSLPVRAYQTPQPQAFGAAVSTPAAVAGLWQDRGDITSLNLLDGPGGKEHRPAGK